MNEQMITVKKLTHVRWDISVVMWLLQNGKKYNVFFLLVLSAFFFLFVLKMCRNCCHWYINRTRQRAGRLNILILVEHAVSKKGILYLIADGLVCLYWETFSQERTRRQNISFKDLVKWNKVKKNIYFFNIWIWIWYLNIWFQIL